MSLCVSCSFSFSSAALASLAAATTHRQVLSMLLYRLPRRDSSWHTSEDSEEWVRSSARWQAASYKDLAWILRIQAVVRGFLQRLTLKIHHLKLAEVLDPNP